MANKYRGEVPFTADGKDYIFRLGTNEMVKLEKMLRVENALEEFGKGKLGLSGLRTMTYVGLSRHHPDLTEEEAGDIIDEIGGFEALSKLIEESMGALIVEGKDPKPEAAGTGPVSLPPPSAQG